MTSDLNLHLVLRDADGTHWCTDCHAVHGDQDWQCPANGADLLLPRR